MAKKDHTVTSAYITIGQAAIMRQEDNGTVAATGKYDAQVAQKLVRGGLLHHRHGLIYEVTPRGAKIVQELRDMDREAVA
jgi:hypothetical protein